MATFTITVTIPDAAAQRAQAALDARNTTPKALLVAALIQLVQQYEMEQATRQVGTIPIS